MFVLLYSYAALVTCRLFLGIFEAAVTPGFVSPLSFLRIASCHLADRSLSLPSAQILITGRFYTRKEQISRTALWFSVSRVGLPQQPAKIAHSYAFSFADR